MNAHRKKKLWLVIYEVVTRYKIGDLRFNELLADALYTEIILRVRPKRIRRNQPPSHAYVSRELPK